MAKARILIVEDEAIEALDIQQRLVSMGYSVPVIAGSGEEGVRKAEETSPDLVLMDIMLPGKIDGVMAAERIRTRLHIPIVYLTAYADDNTLQRAKITEPYAYIVKPFQEKELHIAIEIALYKHKMERKLQESEEWFSTTLRSIGDAVMTTDNNGQVTFMNPVAENLTGWKWEDALKRKLTEVFKIINRDTHQSVEDPVARVLREGKVIGLANHTDLIARDGAEISIEDSGAPIRDDKGNTIGVVLVFHDVTERQRMEKAIHFQASIAAAATDALIVVDTDDFNVYWNKAAENLYGWREDEVMGKRVSDILQSEFPGMTREEVTEYLNQHGRWSGEVVNTRNDGSRVTVLQSSVTLKDTDGGVAGYISSHKDITAMKKADELIRFQSMLVDRTHDAIISSTLTPEGEFITRTWNRGAETLYGWRAEEAIGKATIDFLQPEFPGSGTLEEYVKQLMEQGSWGGEVTIKRKDGSKVTVLTSQTVLRDAGGKIIGAVGVHHDITEMKKAEQIKDEFIGMVSHELKTPLTVIIGALSVAKTEGLPQEQIRELLQDADSQADRLARIVDNLLELSRYQSQRLVLWTERTDVERVVKMVIQELQTRSDKHRLATDIPPGLPAAIIDPTRMELVLHNLVDNAIKYSPQGGEVRVSVRHQDNQLVFGVSDQGMGISPEDRTKLFQDFQRLETLGSRVIPGVGLGLKVCRVLVEAHGGRIWMESSPGKGSTFFFTLPVASLPVKGAV